MEGQHCVALHLQFSTIVAPAGSGATNPQTPAQTHDSTRKKEEAVELQRPISDWPSKQTTGLLRSKSSSPHNVCEASNILALCPGGILVFEESVPDAKPKTKHHLHGPGIGKA